MRWLALVEYLELAGSAWLALVGTGSSSGSGCPPPTQRFWLALVLVGGIHLRATGRMSKRGRRWQKGAPPKSPNLDFPWNRLSVAALLGWTTQWQSPQAAMQEASVQQKRV